MIEMEQENRQAAIEVGTETDDSDFQNECFKYMADFARIIYENEERREASLIQQASQMQTAFSFVIAAVFMLAAIIADYPGPFSLLFRISSFASITVALVASLFCATMAQNRYKRHDFPKVSTIKTKIIEEYTCFITEAQRSKYLLDTYEKMHNSYEKTNDKRLRWVKSSMVIFYIAILLCVFWFVIGIFKIYRW